MIQMKNNNKSKYTLIEPQYIKKYDILRWNALDSSPRGYKYRPFLVIQTDPKQIVAIPITHTDNKSTKYGYYNVPARPLIDQAIRMSTDKPGKNYFKPVDQIAIKRSTFKTNQLPQRCGNLMDFVPRKLIRQQIRDNDNMVQKLYDAHKEYVREMKYGQVHHYRERAKKRDVISDHDFAQFLVAKYVGMEPLEKRTYQPIDRKNKSQYHNYKHYYHKDKEQSSSYQPAKGNANYSYKKSNKKYNPKNDYGASKGYKRQPKHKKNIINLKDYNDLDF